jgi:hypothetical protein
LGTEGKANLHADAFDKVINVMAADIDARGALD